MSSSRCGFSPFFCLCALWLHKPVVLISSTPVVQRYRQHGSSRVQCLVCDDFGPSATRSRRCSTSTDTTTANRNCFAGVLWEGWDAGRSTSARVGTQGWETENLGQEEEDGAGAGRSHDGGGTGRGEGFLRRCCLGTGGHRSGVRSTTDSLRVDVTSRRTSTRSRASCGSSFAAFATSSVVRRSSKASRPKSTKGSSHQHPLKGTRPTATSSHRLVRLRSFAPSFPILHARPHSPAPDSFDYPTTCTIPPLPDIPRSTHYYHLCFPQPSPRRHFQPLRPSRPPSLASTRQSHSHLRHQFRLVQRRRHPQRSSEDFAKSAQSSRVCPRRNSCETAVRSGCEKSSGATSCC